MDTFKLEIELGNDAMHGGAGLAYALRMVADHFDRRGWKDYDGRIMDENGNTVGKWEVS